jgi:hypothetical protein
MGLCRLRLSEIATLLRENRRSADEIFYLAFLVPAPGPSDHAKFIEQLLAVPDQQDV